MAYDMRIGAQLYTVREYMKNLDDFAETLKKVADIGYTTVQVSGACEFEPEWLKEQLAKNGLECHLTHTAGPKMLADPAKVAADHKVFGCKYIGIGSMPGNLKDNGHQVFEDFVKNYKPVAQAFTAAGEYFMFHNHHAEYTMQHDGKNYMQLLGEAFAPEEMGFTLDTYWAQFAGEDPAAEIRRMAGRLPCIHYKDMEILEDGTKRFTWVGGGVLDFEKITEAAQAAGTKYIFIEQDNCFGEDPFVCLKKSHDYLNSIGLK